MMGKLNRFTVLIGAVAVLMLSVAAVTVTSRVTNAGGANQTTTVDCAANQAGDAAETTGAPDTDLVDEQCGPQDATDSAAEPADASEPKDAADTDAVEQQDGPQDAADAPADPAKP